MMKCDFCVTNKPFEMVRPCFKAMSGHTINCKYNEFGILEADNKKNICDECFKKENEQ